MVRVSRISTRNKSDKSSITDSARRGSFRISDNAVFKLLNKKCGRIRACNACSAPLQCRRKSTGTQLKILLQQNPETAVKIRIKPVQTWESKQKPFKLSEEGEQKNTDSSGNQYAGQSL
jgi:hypothetical protein